jgi:phosphohistidine phosphatase
LQLAIAVIVDRNRGNVSSRNTDSKITTHTARVWPVVNFYLVRHGDALSATENPQRPLSSDGRRHVELTARCALERSINVSVIYHSGILRAKETAEILAKQMSVATVAELSGLLPEDDPAIVKAELDAAVGSLLLVGHLPFMSRLAGLLINGDPERPAVEFFPATMVCCARSATHWKISWVFAP